MWKVDLPLKIPISSTKSFALNLNTYRNAHFQVLHKAKKNFTEKILPKIYEIPPLDKAKITYTLFPGSKRLCDISNICSIVDKFFCDALVEANCLVDDNYTRLTNIEYKIGSVDPVNPRVEAVIERIDDMQIVIELNSEDLNNIVKTYLEDKVKLQEGETFKLPTFPNFRIEVVKSDVLSESLSEEQPNTFDPPVENMKEEKKEEKPVPSKKPLFGGLTRPE